MNITAAIHVLYPQVVRTVDGEALDIDGNVVTYDRAAVEQHAVQMEAQQQRSAAYQQEADPLFFKYQAGEVDKADWIAKREEIRQRFPYPLDAATTTEEVTS